jgi:hypothetical protein
VYDMYYMYWEISHIVLIHTHTDNSVKFSNDVLKC